MKLAAMTISKNSIKSAIRGAFVADAASMVRFTDLISSAVVCWVLLMVLVMLTLALAKNSLVPIGHTLDLRPHGNG
jgi:hypothetical protein